MRGPEVILMRQQRTLRHAIGCAGVGLHSGARVALTLRPAAEGSGIRFRRALRWRFIPLADIAGVRVEGLRLRGPTRDVARDLVDQGEQLARGRDLGRRRARGDLQQRHLLGQLDQAQETRLAALVDVYQRMRAKDAANVFNGLDDDVMVQVASRMRQANLAEVMGRMDPARARTLTQLLADRARPPTSGANLLDRSRGATPPQTPAAPSSGQ